MKNIVINSADIDRTDTWVRYRNGLCQRCAASCCTMPAEVRVADLIRIGVVDAFDADEDPKKLAKRLDKAGVIDHFNHRSALFTLARRANGDCLYLDRETRLCTIYDKRPDTCRNHPRIGPRPGFCAFRDKQAGA